MTYISRPAKGLLAAMVLLAVSAFGLMAVRLDATAGGPADAPCNRVYGVVFQDNNVNGNPDVGEPGIGGSTVKIYQSALLVGTTVTAANGYFEFSGLGALEYEIVQTNTAAYPGNSTPNSVFVEFGTTCVDSDTSDTDIKETDVTSNSRSAIIGSPINAQVVFGDLLAPPPVQTQGVPNLPLVTPIPTKTATATATASATGTATATATAPAATATPTSAATATATPTSGVGGVGGTGPGSTGGAQPTPKPPTAGSGFSAEPANPLFWVIILLGASVLCGTAGAGVIASSYRRK